MHPVVNLNLAYGLKNFGELLITYYVSIFCRLLKFLNSEFNENFNARIPYVFEIMRRRVLGKLFLDLDHLKTILIN